MKSSYSSDLIALLQRNASVWPNTPFDALWRIHLYKIGPLQNGQMIYATDAQLPISYGSNIYDPIIYGNWKRGAISSKLGLSPSEMDLTVSSGQQNPIYFPGTTALLADGIKFGLMNGAAVTLYIYYAPRTMFGTMTGPTGGSLVGIKFVGEITEINSIGLTSVQMKASDLRYLLNVDVPQRVFTPQCWWVLYSQGCTLNKASFSETSSVDAVIGTNTFSCSTIAKHSAAGTYQQGFLTWTSGANKGLTSYIKTYTSPGSSPDVIVLDVPPIFGLTVGDGFTIYQGCDKTFASCLDLQGSTNAAKNFGGQPTVPVPETAIG